MTLRRALVLPLLLAGLLPALAPSEPASAAVDPGTGTTYADDAVVVPIVFPVLGPVSWTDTFLACRSGCTRKHMGQDLMGPKMSPLVAAFDGTVTSVSRDSPYGNSIVLTADRGPAAGWSAVYIHVNNDTPGTDDGKGTAQYAFPSGIEVGTRVLAGQLVGWRGDSGDAETTGPHLHFELHQSPSWGGWGGVVHNARATLLAARHLRTPVASGPHPSGTLLRHPNGALYLLDGTSKRLVTPAVLPTLRRDPATAVPMSAAESMGYRTGPPAVSPDGSLVRDPAGAVWLVTGGTRVAVPDLAAVGRAGAVPVDLPDADLAALPVADALPPLPVLGTLLRTEPGLAQVGADGLLHAVTPDVAGSYGWTSADVATLPDGTALPGWGDPLTFRDGTLVQTPGHVVGVVSGGALRVLHDAREVAAYGYTGRPRQLVPSEQVAGLRLGEVAGP